MSVLVCPECECEMRLIDGPKGRFYSCIRWPYCSGKHGAHPDGSPMGTPATAETRVARHQAHEAFDPLWQTASSLYADAAPSGRSLTPSRIKKLARARAYAWLAEQLGILIDNCHMGLFDKATCDRVVQICSGVTAADIRAWAKAKRDEVIA